MKKILFVLTIIAMFVLAGCAQQQKVDIIEGDSAAPQIDDSVEEPTVTKMTQEVKDILAKADKKVESFSYYHSEPPVDTESDHIFVMGSKVKIVLFEPKNYDKRIYFDTVYLDTSARTAVAYCEHKDDVRCPDKDRQFDVKYSDYFRKTSYMWANEITFAEKIGEEQIDQKDVDVLQYERGGKTYKVYINAFYGLAQKAEIVNEKDDVQYTYLFSELDVNKLDEEDLIH